MIRLGYISKPLKAMLNRENRLFNNYKRYGYKAEEKVRFDAFRIEFQKEVETAKLFYLTILGNNVNNPGTSQKSYRKIINRVMNKCSAPKIPPSRKHFVYFELQRKITIFQ